MARFKNGQTVEVGIGEDIHDEDGWSDYIFIDIENVSDNEIEKLFPMVNVLYIELATDAQTIEWGKENPLSNYLK